jgi:hypothetical protein
MACEDESLKRIAESREQTHRCAFAPLEYLPRKVTGDE